MGELAHVGNKFKVDGCKGGFTEPLRTSGIIRATSLSVHASGHPEFATEETTVHAFI